MKTVIIYGTEHKGNTYNIVQLFKNMLNIASDELIEYFLPKDAPHFCIGCNNCFMKGEDLCPHHDCIAPIKQAVWNAELIILASPSYVFHITGQMKALLDHFAFQFMAHRPDKSMFSKTALVVSTAAGAGMRSAIKDITGSLSYWGVSRIFTFGFAVRAPAWEDVSAKRKAAVERTIRKMSRTIKTNINKPEPGLKTKALFGLFRIMHKKNMTIPNDKEYWEKHGWLGKSRPWRVKN